MEARIAQLERALKEKDRSIEENIRSIEEKDAALEEKDAALEEKDAALAKQGKDLEEKDRALSDLELVAANTIKNIYTESVSGEVQAKAPPPLTLNKWVTPSLDGHERKGQILAPAEIHNMEDEGSTSMWIQPDRVTVPIRDSEDGRLLPSELGGKLGRKPTYPLEYSNEVDIQHFVRALVGDAITSLGLGEVLREHVEVALYGIIPDVIVVRVRGRVVFFVEVKCPDVPDTSNKKTTVFTSKYVAGQVHSYLMAMLQHGNERPTGAIMTYNKMCLVSLKDTKEDAERKTLIEEASVKLEIDWRKQVDVEDEAPHESCNRNSSPSRTQKQLKILVQPYVAKTVPKKEKVQDNKNEQDLDESCDPNSSRSRSQKELETPVQPDVAKAVPKKEKVEDSTKDQDLDSTVSYSRIYENAEIFPALLQALQLAFDDSIKMQIDAHLPVAKDDEPLGGRLFLKGNDESTKFVVTAEALKANAKKFPGKTSKTFYLLAQLGTGKVGKTYLACNSAGKLCAVKMYIPKRSVATTADAREEEWTKRYEEEEKKRNEELKRWKELCNSNLTFGVKLCGNPCVVMPYGIEIPSDERTEGLVRGEITDLLTKLAKKGFSYKELRWRHILRDCKKKVFLVDLESLIDPVKSPTRKWVASVVKKQVDELLKKFATATPPRADAYADANVPVELASATSSKKRKHSSSLNSF
jgi:hypothetical protein